MGTRNEKGITKQGIIVLGERKVMIITIHQPEHLPWLGYFNKMAKAEAYVILDNVPFRKNYVQNRNKILGTNGAQWLGVPVFINGHIDGTIKTTKIANETQPKWKMKYLKTLEQSYKKYPYYDEVFSDIEGVIMQDWISICDLNVSLFKVFAKKMKIAPKFVFASDLNVSGNKSDLILDICKSMNTDTYIAGPSGRKYLDIESFDVAGIKVVYNDYSHPQYTQKRTTEFVPYLSAVDLFMNCGYEESYKIIMNGNETFSEV